MITGGPPTLWRGGAEARRTRREDAENLFNAFQNVVLLSVFFCDLADDLPFVAVGDVDAAVGVVFHADFFVNAGLFDLAGVAGGQVGFGDAEGVHWSYCDTVFLLAVVARPARGT